MNEWDPRPIEDIEAAAARQAARDAAIAAALDPAPDPASEANATRAAIKRQLILLGAFLLCAGLLFVLAAASGPYGAGCGGG